MSKILAMFPGQGSQSLGMARELLSEFPYTKSTFEQAEDAISLNIRKMCDAGDQAALNLTANQQPCILTVSIAKWLVLQEERGLKPSLFAGHSLGEYSALVASGKLDFMDAVKLVRRRGESMQEAVQVGVGAMAAVMKYPKEKLEALCKSCSSADAVVEIANYNSPQQLIISGHKSAVDQVGEILKKEGAKSVQLPVSAPFHSSLMRKSKEVMRPLLLGANFHKTQDKVIANIDAQIYSDYPVMHLVDQIDGAVQWSQSMENAEVYGISMAIEIGPGKVLCGLASRCFQDKNIEILATASLQEALAQF